MAQSGLMDNGGAPQSPRSRRQLNRQAKVLHSSRQPEPRAPRLPFLCNGAKTTRCCQVVVPVVAGEAFWAHA